MPTRAIADVLRDQHLVRLAPGASAAEAAVAMTTHHVGAVVVTKGPDDGAALIGIFTERDLVERVVAPGRPPHDTPLSEVMTHRPLAITPQTSVREALRLMKEHHLRHLPVVRGDAVVGVVSVRDFLPSETAEFAL
jgi:CBS domain-containing protein